MELKLECLLHNLFEVSFMFAFFSFISSQRRIENPVKHLRWNSTSDIRQIFENISASCIAEDSFYLLKFH